MGGGAGFCLCFLQMLTCHSSLTQSDTKQEEEVLLNVEKEERLVFSSSCLPFSQFLSLLYDLIFCQGFFFIFLKQYYFFYFWHFIQMLLLIFIHFVFPVPIIKNEEQPSIIKRTFFSVTKAKCCCEGIFYRRASLIVVQLP